MSSKCHLCGAPERCLAGHSGHPQNWYCSDEENCGYRAWSNNTIAQREAQEKQGKEETD